MPQALWHRNRARAITDGVRRLSDLPEAEAREALRACSGSSRWVEAMLSQRPFRDRDDVFDSGDRIWLSLAAPDWLEALRAEPGVPTPGSDLRGLVEAHRRVIAARLEALLALGS
jgi:hypothetical protein